MVKQVLFLTRKEMGQIGVKTKHKYVKIIKYNDYVYNSFQRFERQNSRECPYVHFKHVAFLLF